MIIFDRLRAASLKFNYPKCSFGLKDIPFLGYVITQEGIKPDPRKVQVIMYIWQPNTTTKPPVLICMVYYYREMWPRQSYIISTLTESASGPKGRKMLWNDALKNPLRN